MVCLLALQYLAASACPKVYTHNAHDCLHKVCARNHAHIPLAAVVVRMHVLVAAVAQHQTSSQLALDQLAVRLLTSLVLLCVTLYVCKSTHVCVLKM